MIIESTEPRAVEKAVAAMGNLYGNTAVVQLVAYRGEHVIGIREGTTRTDTDSHGRILTKGGKVCREVRSWLRSLSGTHITAGVIE